MLDLEAQVPDSLSKAVLDLYKDEGIPEAFSGQTILDLIHWHKSLKLGRKKKTVDSKFGKIIAQSVLEKPLQLDNSKGAARFDPIEISPQGNILNWPDGFFDETMLQEDRITSARMILFIIYV